MRNAIIVVAVLVVVGFVGFVLTSGNSSAQLMPEAINSQGMHQDINSEDESVSESMSMKNIVEIAAADDQFSTLVTAVKEADLVDTLSSRGPFTVFAPTNSAFDKLPKETLEEVLADKEQLTAILTYHVVPDKVMAEDVVKLHSAKTVQGNEVKIKVEGETVMVDNAKVVKTDIEAENGVIHVIDTVLIPK